jgi:outer membrane protein TolC
VIDASRDALQAERADDLLAGQRLAVAIQLIKALGGGWQQNILVATSPTADAAPSAKARN